jgi:putative acyl-CoA dehydrogenase
MQNVLADLLVETEAAIALVLRLARMFEHDASPDERALARVATPALKYWLCKRSVPVVAEALEVLGGNGYVEENVLPRLYREAPLNSIWEGSGNVICLDVLRAVRRESAALDALRAELALAHGADSRLDRHVAALDATLVAIAQQTDDTSGDGIARRVAGSIATALAGALLVRFAPAAVADVYCASRFGDDPSRCYGGALGTLPPGTDNAAVIARAG